MKKTAKKLNLSKETLRSLKPSDLDRVEGGFCMTGVTKYCQTQEWQATCGELIPLD